MLLRTPSHFSHLTARSLPISVATKSPLKLSGEPSPFPPIETRLGLCAIVAAIAIPGVEAQSSIDIPNSSNPWSCLAESTGVHVPGTVPHNANEPLQQRVAFAGTNGMTVWSGNSPTNLTSVATRTSTTYPSSSVWDSHVTITGLKSNTTYWYRASYQNSPGCAYRTLDKFTTAREPSDESPFTVVVVIDLGLMGQDGLNTRLARSEVQRTYSGRTPQHDPESRREPGHFRIHRTFGDLAYSDYFIKESWEGYFGNNSLIPNMTSVVEGYNVLPGGFYDQMSFLTSSKPYMVAKRNHEANCDNGGTTDTTHNITYTTSICVPGQMNFTGYINHFRMPSAESGGLGNFWYSFDYGLAHFIVLDTEIDLPVGLQSPDEVGGSDAGANSGPFSAPNEQYDWFEKDLASVDRNLTPWVIVGLHRPWYIATKNTSSTVCLAFQQAFEPLMIKYGVDLYMQCLWLVPIDVPQSDASDARVRCECQRIRP